MVSVIFYHGRLSFWRDVLPDMARLRGRKLVQFVVCGGIAWATGRRSWRLPFFHRADFTHVEIVPEGAEYGQTALAYGASERDHGVRAKQLKLDRDSWIIVPMPHLPQAEVQKRIEARLGLGYDYIGALFSASRHRSKGQMQSRYFCSELVATVIGLDHPEGYSPQELYAKIADLAFA